MKICWDNLEKIRFTKEGNFKKGSDIYIEVDSCKYCKESFLALRRKNQEYCSISCGNMGKKRDESTKLKISRTFKKLGIGIGIKFSEKHKRNLSLAKKGKKGSLSGGWKGGVCNSQLPLYNTFVKKIDYFEEVRPYINSEGVELLQIKCSKCKKWFIPKQQALYDRIYSFEGARPGESRFYCSDECKNICPIYWKVKYPNGYSPKKYRNKNKLYTDVELNIWAQEVLSRANHICEICGAKAEHAHHIQPKKLEPFFALDPENGLAVCMECHNEYGHKGECSTGNLANKTCKGDN